MYCGTYRKHVLRLLDVLLGDLRRRHRARLLGQLGLCDEGMLRHRRLLALGRMLLGHLGLGEGGGSVRVGEGEGW